MMPKFFINNINFFSVQIPSMFLVFIGLKIAFYLLRNYRISVIIREYAFNSYFLMMIMQGKIIYFTYLFVSDILLMGRATWYYQFYFIFLLVSCFLFLAFLISNQFLVLASYKKNCKYFFENVFGNLNGAIYLVLMSIKSVMMGVSFALLN